MILDGFKLRFRSNLGDAEIALEEIAGQGRGPGLPVRLLQPEVSIVDSAGNVIKTVAPAGSPRWAGLPLPGWVVLLGGVVVLSAAGALLLKEALSDE